MSFLDDMKQLSSEYDKEKLHGKEKETLDSCLYFLKSDIRRYVANGEKNISHENRYLFGTQDAEYVDLHLHVGIIRVHISWSLTEKAKTFLNYVKEAAAQEGITITDFSFTLYNIVDDADCYSHGPTFFDDHGALTLSKKDGDPYYGHFTNSDDWGINVKCNYHFSV